MDINEILQYLPHRYPFLLVDRIVEFEEGKRLLALKNVTINEPFFPGHFPHRPVMPGVLILEAMAQAAAVLSFKTVGHRPDENSIVYFAGIDKARFKRPVGPGDQLMMEVTIARKMRNIWKYEAVARVDGEVAAEAELMCALKTLP
ncbi:3-hydroxyacyl-ACP dehydratase FabZ [Rhodocyclaceae bacterium SMB388]